ncbi:MAG: hypothetical protein ACRD0F_07105, partial [Acidimicrobiales bacterium]
VQAELEGRAAEADALRRQHVERARHAAEQARRRYLAVDPDNRLVAANLEADWNEALRALTRAQEDYERQAATTAWSPGGERLASGGWDGTVRVWDASSGALQAERHLSSIGWAHLDGSGQPVRCSGDAWDWLSWEVRDPATGQLLRLPAETFGPLPGIEPPSHLR